MAWENRESVLRFSKPLLVLKAEQPDIDPKRSNLIKFRGKFQLRLRHLEKNLLTSLNKAKGMVINDNIRWMKAEDNKALSGGGGERHRRIS